MQRIPGGTTALRLRSDGQPYRQVAYAEVLVPNVANVYGDYWTEEEIVSAAHLFMESQFGIDIEHDNVDITGSAHVVESFIVRAGDPDFILGSWVVGMHIVDPDVWQQVLDANLNGFSYEAVVSYLTMTLEEDDDGIRQGVTEPHIEDGHTHEFTVFVDENNRPISGGTTETGGHSHTISRGVVTGEAEGHVHRYNLVTGRSS